MKKPVLIFDYDGTIQETLRIYYPAVRETALYLKESGYLTEIPTQEQAKNWLGMSVEEMWQDFMPELPGEKKREAGELIGRKMSRSVSEGTALWYNGISQMLLTCRKDGYRMFVLSNCPETYAKEHWKAFCMERFFDAFFTCEGLGGISKAAALLTLTKQEDVSLAAAANRNTGSSPASCFEGGSVMIGDRKSDVEAGRKAGSTVIGCCYGYGSPDELREADYQVHHAGGLYTAVLQASEDQITYRKRGL